VCGTVNRSEIFSYFGAPLTNVRWSWGAVRASDGAVFLLVWQDQSKRIEGKQYTLVNDASYFQGEPANLGQVERIRQVELIRGGARSYMVMCLAVDPKVAPRTMASFNDQDVFVGGQLIDVDGNTWLERVERKSIAAAC
jgi:hypothetical protein